MKLTRIAERIFNEPLLISESTMMAMLSGMSDRFDISEIEGLGGDEVKQQAFSSGQRSVNRPYEVVDGVAVIPIDGKLVNKSGYLKSRSGIQGYDGILAQYSIALSDSAVQKILFDINSGGGEVAGCFDLCDLIYAHREEKETVAFVGEHACSAAYALASSCSKVITPRTGVCGSIGVLVAHTDVSKKMKDDGIKVTLIHSGKAKVEGNMFEELSGPVKKKIQSRIDSTRELFASTVARNRGISKEAVMETEANVYQGEEAVKIGLADSVMSFNEVLINMTKEVNEGAQGMSAEDESQTMGDSTDLATDAEADFDAVALANLCKEHNASHLLAAFIEQGQSLEGAKAIIKESAELRDVLTAAEFSPEQIAKVEKANSPADRVRAIIDAQAETEEINSHIPGKDKNDAKAKRDWYEFENKL